MRQSDCSVFQFTNGYHMVTISNDDFGARSNYLRQGQLIASLSILQDAIICDLFMIGTCFWRQSPEIQYIPRNMYTVFALLSFVVVIHWLIFPYPSVLLHWHCGNLTIAPVPAKQSWWIWINTSCEFIMNDCITQQSKAQQNCVHISWDILYGSWKLYAVMNVCYICRRLP